MDKYKSFLTDIRSIDNNCIINKNDKDKFKLYFNKVKKEKEEQEKKNSELYEN